MQVKLTKKNVIGCRNGLNASDGEDEVRSTPKRLTAEDGFGPLESSAQQLVARARVSGERAEALPQRARRARPRARLALLAVLQYRVFARFDGSQLRLVRRLIVLKFLRKTSTYILYNGMYTFRYINWRFDLSTVVRPPLTLLASRALSSGSTSPSGTYSLSRRNRSKSSNQRPSAALSSSSRRVNFTPSKDTMILKESTSRREKLLSELGLL